jgi:hypothetical protein
LVVSPAVAPPVSAIVVASPVASVATVVTIIRLLVVPCRCWGSVRIPHRRRCGRELHVGGIVGIDSWRGWGRIVHGGLE